jgi:hypothetical protein
MARRFVYFQGSPALPEFPLKLLLEKYSGDDQGYYVGGWNQEPVFVAPLSSPTYNRIRLYGITATGPGPNDWVVGGWAWDNAFLDRLVFYGATGFLFESVINDSAFFSMAGHFAAAADVGIDRFYWATSQGTSGTRSSPDFIQGFVLPNVFAELRLDVTQDTLRQQVVPNPDLSYAIFVGNNSVNTTLYPNGNPWLATAAGTFTRLNTDLNAVIPRSDLIGLTLYDKGVDAYAENIWWPAAGQQSLTVTPWQLTTGGTATEGTPFPVAYVAPDPAQYFAWDASLWVEPPTP